MEEAQKQDVIVLFNLFDACLKKDYTYGKFNAWNPDRNNQDVNQLNRLGEIQQAYVTRMTKTLKEYDNVVFEILNEPCNSDVGQAAL